MLTRLALRLATVEALLPHAKIATAGPFPTLCGKNVFDTRLDPIDDLNPNERVPVAVVLTEETNGDAIGQGNGQLKFTIDVVVEISVPAFAPDPDNPEVIIAGVPASDAELEANLDLVESQIRFALATSVPWSGLVQKITDWDSLPHRTSEEGVRLALRTIRIKAQISDDCFRMDNATDLVGVDRLPPKVRKIYDTLDPASYGAKILAGLSPSVPAAPARAPLKGVDLTIPVADPSGATVAAPLGGKINNLDL